MRRTSDVQEQRSGNCFQLKRQRPRRFECLEPRELLDASGQLWEAANARQVSFREFAKNIDWSASDVNSALIKAGRSRDLIFTPTVVGGSASGTPADSPNNAVASNIPVGSVYGGVAHIKILIPNFPRPIPGTSPQQFDAGNLTTVEFACTGSVISPTYVLTAAHCFDAMNESDPVTDGELNPGNGIMDPGATAEVQLNDGDAAGDGLFSSEHTVSSITLHPSFAGFATNSNDDLALLELSTPVPFGTPIYSIADTLISAAPSRRINVVGYGLTGSGDTGLITNPSDPDYRSPEVKRQRQNVADVFVADDETVLIEPLPGIFVPVPAGPNEIFIFDFDGPTGDGFLGGATLGNDVEGNVAPGDSGGPAFLMDSDGNLLTDSMGQLIIGGINTFNGAFGFGADPGLFVTSSAPVGGLSGGIMLGAYDDWIHSITGVDLQLSSQTTVTAGAGSDTTVTYALTLTNDGPNDATGVAIQQSQMDLPVGATVTVDSATSGYYFFGNWIVGSLPAGATETLTFTIEFDPTVASSTDPFEIGFAVGQVVEHDNDPDNDTVFDSLPLTAPVAATIGGSSWVVNPVPLNVGPNATLSWINLDTFSVTYPVAFTEAPPVELYGPSEGEPAIVTTLDSFDGLTATYSVPALSKGYYKLVASGTDIDFSVLPGDANGSSKVDIFDFAAFVGAYQPSVFQGSTALTVDFNGTGIVDIFDFAIFVGNYQTDLSAYTPPTVPLPPPPSTTQLASAMVIDAVWAAESGDEEEVVVLETQRRRFR